MAALVYDMKEGELPIQKLSLGDTLTNWADTIDSETTLSSWTLANLDTIVTDQAPTCDVKPKALFRAGDSFIRASAKHCNFEGDECWNVRVHPLIESIDASEGYATGGQELTISGFGLKGDAEVLVDGVICKVTATSDDEITCKTDSVARLSTTGYQPGQPGLRQTTIEPENENTLPGEDARTNDNHVRT